MSVPSTKGPERQTRPLRMEDGKPAGTPFVLTDLSSRRFTDALFDTLVNPIGADDYWMDSALFAAGTRKPDSSTRAPNSAYSPSVMPTLPS